MTVPASLLLQQGDMLKTLGRILVKSAVPGQTPSENPDHFPPVSESLSAPSDKLVRHYLEWAGAPAERYTGELPPHLFTQWALPLASQHLELLKYKLSGIINQGCDVRINGPLPAGAELKLTAEMVDITETNGRARVHQRLLTGTEAQPDAVEVDFFTAFIIGKGNKKKKAQPEKPEFETVATWDATPHDGLKFGILTGDLNPIHWITPLAKLSPFKGKVLHGFGMFVRSYEALQNGTGETVREIGVRFIRPVPLPSKGLQVCRSVEKDENGRHQLELRNSKGDTLMIGHYAA